MIKLKDPTLRSKFEDLGNIIETVERKNIQCKEIDETHTEIYMKKVTKDIYIKEGPNGKLYLVGLFEAHESNIPINEEHSTKHKQPSKFTRSPTPTVIEVNLYAWIYIEHSILESLQNMALKSGHKLNMAKYENIMEMEVISTSQGRVSSMQDISKTVRAMQHSINQRLNGCVYETISLKYISMDMEVADQIIKSTGVVAQRKGNTLHLFGRVDQIPRLITILRNPPQAANTMQAKHQPENPYMMPTHAAVQPGFDRMIFDWKSRIKIYIYKEDITKLRVGAIVNAANSRLDHAGGVAYAIARAAGYQLQQDCDAHYRQQGPVSVGRSYTSPGYNLPSTWVVHVVGPMWSQYRDKERCCRDLYQAFVNCLEEADRLEVDSLAIPAISSGIYIDVF